MSTQNDNNAEMQFKKEVGENREQNSIPADDATPRLLVKNSATSLMNSKWKNHTMRNPFVRQRRRRLQSHPQEAQVLEPRRLLSAKGNVTVTRNQQTREVEISGDDLSNEIEIVENARGGLIVRGVDHLLPDATTVNGRKQKRLPKGFTIRVKMGDGNDKLYVQGNTRNPVDIDSGVYVEAEGGADLIVINNANIQGHVQIDAGQSTDDTIDFDQVSVFSSSLRSVEVNTTAQSTGFFQVTMQGSTVRRAFRHKGGGGVDSISVTSSTMRMFTVDTGSAHGQENISLVNSVVKRRAQIRSNGQKAFIPLSRSQIKRLDIEFGRNDENQVWMSDMNIQRVKVDGNGADLIHGNRNRFGSLPNIVGFARNWLRWQS